MNDLIRNMSKMLIGDDLTRALTVRPEIPADIRDRSAAERLAALESLYDLYIPTEMSVEIYHKLYQAVMRSLNRKCGPDAVRQKYENLCCGKRLSYRGIVGGADSFTIIGPSGIGKSSSIAKAIELTGADQVFEDDDPYYRIIPALTVQTPFDASPKGLLLEILRKIDEVLDTERYMSAVRAKATTDMLIGAVSQAALSHIGVLIVDEIQNVVGSRTGRALVGMLTQLINNSGISICMVGTPECASFFEAEMQLARRSLGLRYREQACDDVFYGLCRETLKYQIVREPIELTDTLAAWLYEHTGGLISMLVSLVHDAQEMAILNGNDALSIEMLERAYERRMTMLHDFLEPSVRRHGKRPTAASGGGRIKGNSDQEPAAVPDEERVDVRKEDLPITELVESAAQEGTDLVSLIKEYYPVEEVEE